MARLDVVGSDEVGTWCAVLDSLIEYDFYHLPQYHRLAEELGEGNARLFIYREGEWTIALPLLLRSLQDLPGLEEVARGWNDATSVYGYAGPLASHPVVPAEVVGHFQTALEAALQELKVVAVFSRLHPLFEQQLTLLAGLGECPALACTVSVDLTLPSKEQRRLYRRNHKEGINRLRRQGFTCVWDTRGAYLDEFIAIYQETMQRVGAAGAYFFPREYFVALRSAAPLGFHLFVCLHQGQAISACLFLECRGILQYHLGGTRNAMLKLSSIKLIFGDVRQWATERGLRVLHLGGGTTPDPQDSLLHFKRGFSNRSHDFHVWRWVLAPAVYQELCQARAEWNRSNNLLPTNPSWFPSYRCPVTPCPVRTETVAPAAGVERKEREGSVACGALDGPG